MRLQNDRPRQTRTFTFHAHTLAASGSPAPNNRATTSSSPRAAITYSAAALALPHQLQLRPRKPAFRLHLSIELVTSRHTTPDIEATRAGRPGAPPIQLPPKKQLAMAARLLLLLGAAIMVLLASAATAQDCLSATFSGGRTFGRCNSLPSLSASLHWTYHPENGTADVAFRAPSSPSGWVAWGINPTSGGSMGGSSVFVAYQDSSSGGAVSILMTNLESTSPSLTNTTAFPFRVPVGPAAEYSGGAYTIYATVELPRNSTQQFTVWQAGPTSGGQITPHPTAPANLASTQRLDFLSGSSTSASNSRLHRRNIHGMLNAIAWGVLIPIGAIIARYLRVFESADPAWFYLHIACQCSGYILGVAGWGLGLKLGSESAGITYQPHRNIGIAIFALATLQVFALLLRPDKKNKYRFYWNIYHHSVGYAVIVLSAVNIFKGLHILKPATGYKTAYIVILATLGGIALCLEAITWPIAIRKRRRDADKASVVGNGNGWQQGA